MCLLLVKATRRYYKLHYLWRTTLVPDEFIVDRAVRPRLVDVADRLQFALEEAGYTESSFLSVPEGFAIVTRIEQMLSDGQSMGGSARWDPRLTPRNLFSLAAYLRALLTANPGRYRIVVFVVTATPFSQRETKVTVDVAGDWLRSGFNRLPPAVGIKRYSDDHRCTALIYEFERKTADDEPRLRSPSSLTARKHLEKARLWHLLAGTTIESN